MQVRVYVHAHENMCARAYTHTVLTYTLILTYIHTHTGARGDVGVD